MRSTNDEMLAERSPQRWLLPRSQTEYPARPLLDEATIHARRETTFLVLASIFLLGTCALVAIGTSRVVDVSSVLATMGVVLDTPFALLLPLGAIAFAPTFIASGLASHLLGRRRAVALLWVGFGASLAIAGVLRIGDVIDGGDTFAIALASIACFVGAHALFLLAFELLRGQPMIVRLNVASLIAQIGGWSAFGFALHQSGGELMAALPAQTIAGLAAGAALYSFACVFVLAIPAALISRALTVALRVGRDPVDAEELDEPDEPAVDAPAFARRRPPAVIVDEDDERQPYTSGEMRFFSEGDTLHEQAR
jgi:uncharacterized PurR-regulated membrane protein YhhQ (DUF165 family)